MAPSRRPGVLRSFVADGLHVDDSPAAESLLHSVVQAVTEKDPRAEVLAEEFRQLEVGGGMQCVYTDPLAPPSREVWVSELVDSLPFELDLRYPYKRPDHINILEAQSRLSLYKMLARSPDTHGLRHLVGQDSRVNIGAFSNGRSSFMRLDHVQCKASAYELATNSQYGSLWVDSFRMPADAPTREGGIRLPSPARQWVGEFLGGKLSALDARLGV